MKSSRAPTLFSMVFPAMLTDAFQGSDNQVTKIRYRTEGKLFNPRRLQSSTKTREANISKLLFADDCAAISECDMQSDIDKFSSACDMFVLTINTKKTEVMFQAAVNNTYQDPRIKIKGSELVSVDSFTYLGSTSIPR
jgi:hypothetical protein